MGFTFKKSNEYSQMGWFPPETLELPLWSFCSQADQVACSVVLVASLQIQICAARVSREDWDKHRGQASVGLSPPLPPPPLVAIPSLTQL